MKSGLTIKVKNNKHAISDSIKNDVIKTNCPNCNKPISFKIKQIGKQITCPHCNTEIKLTDDGVKKQLGELDKAFNDIFKSL